jgi:HPt (histidine-containing phosphotransfer) domain-containing protein
VVEPTGLRARTLDATYPWAASYRLFDGVEIRVFHAVEVTDMSRMSPGKEPIYSTLVGDPNLGDLVDLFVSEMPDRIASLQSQLAQCDWENLRRTAHQIKGAAGSYGFAPISPSAAKVEDAIRKTSSEEDIGRAVADLVELCQRAQAKQPG